MSNIIIWEDISIKTDILTGITTEDIQDDENDEDYDRPEELITSPFGVFHIKDFFNPMKQYQWQICHTNFNISQNVLDKLEKIDGIEKIVIFSRYRILIAFGKAFSIMSVKKDIYKTFDASQPLSEEALAKKKDLESIYDNWYIYYLSEDEWDYGTEDSDSEEYVEKLNEVREKQKKLGGIIITNETNI